MKMKNYSLALLSVVLLNSCGSHSIGVEASAQSGMVETPQESRPVKTLREYPDFIEFDILSVNDDGSMAIGVVGMEFIDEKSMGEKVLLKYGAPSEIIILDIIRFQGDDFVVLDYNGVKYLTPKRS